MYDDIAVAVDSKDKAVLLLIDFSKAFDTISHNRLCNKLGTRFFFEPTAVRLVRSYLIGRKQAVCCNGATSESVAVTSGVPQGSVLGPLLFSLYIDDLPGVLKYCRIQLFADDVQIYCAHSDSFTAVTQLNEDLQRVARWASMNSLEINYTKTKAMLYGTNQRVDSAQLRVSLGGNDIQFTDHANNLGIIFQNDLRWGKAVSYQCGKVYAGLRTLRITTGDLPQSIKLRLFKTLILPHFIFGDVIHLSMHSAMMSKLEVALNDCARYVYKLNRYTSVRHLQKHLLGCSFRRFYELRTCLFFHRIIQRQSPSYLHDKLTALRGLRVRNFMVPTHRTSLYGDTFFVRGVVIWNAQPTELKQLVSEAMYKKAAKNYFESL